MTEGSDMGDPAIDVKQLRAKIIAEPEMILDDSDVMAALMEANESALGANIVDLRGIAMARLEHRLERLEDTHRSVIAAAYENLAGTNQVHRAILAMLDPMEFEDFLKGLATDVAGILRVDSIRLVLEVREPEAGAPGIDRLHDVLSLVGPGFIEAYVTQGREGVPVRPVTLRQTRPDTAEIYGDQTAWINSEALMKLDFGPGRQPGMLALGAEDPHQFKPTQGTDLLAFFAGVFERQMRRWLG